MNWKVLIVCVLAMLTSACAAPRYSGSAISQDIHENGTEIVLIKDNETRDGFRQTVENWFKKNNYKYVVKAEGSKHEFDKLTIEYVGKWNWDLALYLSDAKMEAFHQGQRVGEVSYKAPNSLNTNKFSNAEERIEYMLEVLFGKLSDIEATKAI
ncbi:Sbal_3080 family lipoprotein [Marinobacterium arenosum]|uniref:Sbal_3080 family lipoprotein n=1 Tax=Marinobacterium arenosum TaxID=2862496 RepID=UPI001C94FC8B|nr:Sbal_3080 family lipoprotein [Marinobacterium arenosum]MBY4676125.1 hypothetical protein [Marinobacterium arenosum]